MVLGKRSQPTCSISPTRLSLSLVNLSRLFGYKTSRSRPVSTPVRIFPATIREQRVPAITFADFRLFPFRSPLLREYLIGFSSLSYLDGSVHLVLPSDKVGMTRYYSGRVPPFGDLRIKVCLRLPEAYRCLPRPLSPSCAKSSITSPL